MLITFEGIDGSGKSTQIDLLADYLKGLEFEVVTLREPGGTELSEAIRELLLNSSYKISSTTELLLFEAARSELVNNIIKPALDAGKIVICDRFFDSTIAYQGYGRGLDIKTIDVFNELATMNIKPDLTFLLDIPLEQAQARAGNKKPDKIESSGNDFFERVFRGFRKIASKEKQRYIVIDANGTIEDTHLKIVKEFDIRFKKEIHRKIHHK